MSYRLKFNITGERFVKKVNTLPKEGETIILFGKSYIIKKLIQMKANFYRARLEEMPMKGKSIWQRLFRR